MEQLIDQPRASESPADASTTATPVAHFEVRSWKDDSGTGCGVECACGVFSDGFATVAEARAVLACLAKPVRAVKHRSWCVPGVCKRDPVGDGTTHFSAVYEVPSDAPTSDTIRLQVWSSDDTHGDSEADATFFEAWIVNRRGETLHSIDLTLSQVLILRALLGVVTPEGEASTYGYRARRPGSAEARKAADAQVDAVMVSAFAFVDSLHADTRPPRAIDLTVAERHLDVAHWALDEWYARETTAERTYVSAGVEAVAAIDDTIRALHQARAELVADYRRDEDERNVRVDAILAESRARRAEREQVDERDLKPVVDVEHEGYALGGRHGR